MNPDLVTCDVWWARPASAEPRLLAFLDGHERERHPRFRLPADRDRYLVSHALARLACARAAGCGPAEVSFTRDCPHCELREPHGKPRPAGAASGLEVSLTHSGQRVAVAVTWGTGVGLDVERVRAPGEGDIEGLADYVLTGAEKAALDALPGSGRTAGFFTYWTRKEALLKATGAGIGGGLNQISVSAPNESAAVLDWKAPGAPDAVWLADLDAGPDYRAALAALTGAPVRALHHDGTALLDAGE